MGAANGVQNIFNSMMVVEMVFCCYDITQFLVVLRSLLTGLRVCRVFVVVVLPVMMNQRSCFVAPTMIHILCVQSSILVALLRVYFAYTRFVDSP